MQESSNRSDSSRQHLLEHQMKEISFKERVRLSSATAETSLWDGSSSSLQHESPPSRSVRRGSSVTTRHIGIEAMSSGISKRNVVKDMFVLQFPAILYDRQEQESALRVRKRPFTAIAGTSGSGKTALACTLEDNCRGLFVKGKFDSQRRNEPLVAFVHALESLCAKINNADDDSSIYTIIQEKLREDLGDEAQVLTSLVPEFGSILNTTIPLNQDDMGISEIRNRSMFAVHRLFEIMAEVADQVTLVLDDLQWADPASVELLKTLVLRDNVKWHLVGCYRSNEVDEWHQVTAELLSEESTTIIEVGNLSFEALNSYVADVLSLEALDCRDLTTVIHRKTLGNIFFVRQFLRSLFEDGYLRYNIGSAKWCWMNEADIDDNTSATANVVDLMQSRLATLPDHVCRVLQFLACLGSEFDMVSLQLAMQFLLQNETVVLEYTVDFARICIDNGLIESVGNRFRFIHDRIQESAIAMLPADERVSLFFEFGRLLSERDDLEERLFTTVDLLNQGLERAVEVESNQLIQIAELNLRAGSRAMASAAFGAATVYFNKGIALLPTNPDRAVQRVIRELKLKAAEAEYCEGNFDTARELCYELIGMGELEMEERVRAQLVLVDTYTAEFRHAEATSLCMKFLDEYGCRIRRPKDIFFLPAFVTSLSKTQSLLKGKTMDDLKHLPRVVDPKKLAVMKMIDRLANAVYFADPMFLPLPIMLLMRWTVKHGVCAQSCSAIAMYAYILCGPLGDLKAGYDYAMLALDLIGRLGSKEVKSKTTLLTHAFVVHRYQPVHLCLRPLELGYKEGMANGNMEHAYNCICAMISHAAMSGKPLKSIEDDLRVYCTQAREFQQQSARLFMVMNWQFVLNMMGGQENTYVLSGVAMSEEAYLDQIAKDCDMQLKAGLERFRNRAAYYFGEYELAAKIISDSTDPQDECFASDLFWDMFFRGLVWAALAKTTKRRKHRWKAQHFAKRLRKLVKAGCPNCEHQLLALEAEISNITGKYDIAAAKYEEAIIMAGRRGFLQDHALTNELFGQFMLEQGEEVKGKSHIDQAIILYLEWGAHAKVDHIKAKFAKFLQ